MKTRIEFYIPVENLTSYLKGKPVIYSSIPANGLIKVITTPVSIVFNKKVGSNIYYIRKAKLSERLKLRFRRKL